MMKKTSLFCLLISVFFLPSFVMATDLDGDTLAGLILDVEPAIITGIAIDVRLKITSDKITILLVWINVSHPFMYGSFS